MSQEQRVGHFPAPSLPFLRSCFRLAQEKYLANVNSLSWDCAQVASTFIRIEALKAWPLDHHLQHQHLGTG